MSLEQKATEVTPVWWIMGTFPNDTRERFVQAPFVLLELDDAFYLSTGGTDTDETELFGADRPDHAEYCARNGWGYFRGTPMKLEESAMGGGDDDTWVAMHKFGII